MQLCRSRFITIGLGVDGCKRVVTPLEGTPGSRDAAAPLSTASPRATDGGISPWQTACQRHLDRFLRTQLYTGESGASALGQTVAVENGLVNSLSACITTYTDEQHRQILSKLEKARHDQYGQVATSVDMCSICDPVVLAYISMLETVTVSIHPKATTHEHMSRSLRLAVEILHPPGAVCWPWPAHASSCPLLPLGADKEAAAQTLIHFMKASFTLDVWVNMGSKATTDAMKALALCGHVTPDTNAVPALITHGASQLTPRQDFPANRIEAPDAVLSCFLICRRSL